MNPSLNIAIWKKRNKTETEGTKELRSISKPCVKQRQDKNKLITMLADPDLSDEDILGFLSHEQIQQLQRIQISTYQVFYILLDPCSVSFISTSKN